MRFCQICAFDRNDDTAERCRQCGADLEPLVDDEDEAEADSAWFHYLQIPNVGTVELVPGRALRMGRETRNELVIPRATADQIATIFWSDDYDEATLREMGSDDHIKVDGVKITGTRTLKGGEDLAIGPLHMTYLRKATRIANAIDAQKSTGQRPNAATPVPEPSREAASAPLARHTRPAPAPRAAGARRSVGAGPAAVCQALEVKKVSGTLRVQTPQARGWITVVNGHPRHAAFGGVSGPEALFAILRLERAKVGIVPGVSAKGAGQKIDLSFAEAIAKLPAAPVRSPTARATPAPRPGAAAPPKPGVPAWEMGKAIPPRPKPPGPTPPPQTGRTPPRPGGPPAPRGPAPGGPPRRPPPAPPGPGRGR